MANRQPSIRSQPSPWQDQGGRNDTPAAVPRGRTHDGDGVGAIVLGGNLELPKVKELAPAAPLNSVVLLEGWWRQPPALVAVTTDVLRGLDRRRGNRGSVAVNIS